jgi:hypothetical protein
METGFLVLVIPGPDSGIAPTARVRGDPGIRSGDDDEVVVRPTKRFPGRTVVLTPMVGKPHDHSPSPAIASRTSSSIASSRRETK